MLKKNILQLVCRKTLLCLDYLMKLRFLKFKTENYSPIRGNVICCLLIYERAAWAGQFLTSTTLFARLWTKKNPTYRFSDMRQHQRVLGLEQSQFIITLW